MSELSRSQLNDDIQIGLNAWMKTEKVISGSGCAYITEARVNGVKVVAEDFDREKSREACIDMVADRKDINGRV